MGQYRSITNQLSLQYIGGAQYVFQTPPPTLQCEYETAIFPRIVVAEKISYVDEFASITTTTVKSQVGPCLD